MINLLKSKWEEILNTIKVEGDLTDVSFKTWIQPLQIVSIEDDMVTLAFPEASIGIDVIKRKYNNLLKNCINDALNEDYDLNIVGLTDNIPKKPTAVTPATGISRKYTFDSFIVGENNNMAYSASLAVAESPADNHYNPLFLYGGSGLGKTHLMHAIGNFILDNYPEKKVLYVTSDEFTREIIEMIRTKKTEIEKSEIVNKYRDVDVLLIDDIQFIIGKERCQIEFFETFNYLYEHNKQIIISSDKSPKFMTELDERFISRFLMGFTMDIQPPTYETRMAILLKKSEDYGLKIDDEVLEFIAESITSNIRELEGALKKIELYSRLNNSALDINSAKAALIEYIPDNNSSELTMNAIINIVCEHYNISKDDIISKKKSKDIAYPRQISMYLCRLLTDNSYEAIGVALGGRDHSTVKHGYEKIEANIRSDENTKLNVDILKKKIIPS